MEEIIVGSKIAVGPCEHWFHRECVGPWYRWGSLNCPYCRRKSLWLAYKVGV
ncbi:hypothetical protein F4821DRAFT_252392, partial [Hypoxylon rubiginosum]